MRQWLSLEKEGAGILNVINADGYLIGSVSLHRLSVVPFIVVLYI